ncbi:MAG: proteasome assembly chaperone family protein [Thaumarchaeota archaeon]|nr:proteasome assembly chaperone family protein [Nitrososphaerota archaeon]
MPETSTLPEITKKQITSPSPKKPVLICGLPGSGYVGKLAVDYLVTILKAKKFMEFYSSSFPPHVNVNEGGLATMLKGELYHAETGQQNDLIIFTADTQPTTSSGEYELAEAVVMEAKKMNAELVFSLAAYITGSFVKERRVFGTVTSSELLPKLSENAIQIMHEGGISGMNGVIIGMAKLHGIQGISLLGETPGYILDPAASQSVLEALSRILSIKVDMAALQERAKEAQQIMTQVQGMTEQNIEESRPPRDETEPGYIA